eukprot:Mycagemm_TRINITY_DN9957_c0_g1::TRINITY_DN9957_c0_g1_i1::g.3440::m.3440 type:complete len:195 gc:universal TRINITY_DN9957_c0_g1_i1:814-230(-)
MAIEGRPVQRGATRAVGEVHVAALHQHLHGRLAVLGDGTQKWRLALSVLDVRVRFVRDQELHYLCLARARSLVHWRVAASLILSLQVHRGTAQLDDVADDRDVALQHRLVERGGTVVVARVHLRLALEQVLYESSVVALHRPVQGRLAREVAAVKVGAHRHEVLCHRNMAVEHRVVQGSAADALLVHVAVLLFY